MYPFKLENEGVPVHSCFLRSLDDVHCTHYTSILVFNPPQGEPVREIGVVVSLGTGFTQPKKIAHVKWRPFLDIVRDAFALNVFKLKEGVEAAINLKDILVDQVRLSVFIYFNSFIHSFIYSLKSSFF